MFAGSRQKQNQEIIQGLDTRYRASLMRYFLRRVGNQKDAEDLTQETFVRLMGSETFDPSGHVDAYIFRIASNLLRDRAKFRARHPEFTFSGLDPDLAETIFDTMSEDYGPERVLIGRESLAEVMKCLDGMGERTKTIFILSRLEGMKHRDIAEMLGIGISTVEKSCIAATATLMARFRPKAP